MTERQTTLEGFFLIPVDLPEHPELKGKRTAAIIRFYEETGARNEREADLFLAEIGWTWYDVLEAFSP